MGPLRVFSNPYPTTMNLELFIAQRIHQRKEKGKSVSKPAVRIATAGVAVGLTVMILAVGIVIGFKQEVRNKLIGFGSHIQVGIQVNEKAIEVIPMIPSEDMVKSIESIKEVKHVQGYANQPGIMKTKDNFKGIVLKGVGSDFNWDFFKSNLIAGEVPTYKKDSLSKEILISKKTADLLDLKLHDKILTYFIIDGKVRVRNLHISGIYSTGFSDYDETVVLGDIQNVQHLNGWETGQVGGLEIQIDDYNHLSEASQKVFGIVGNRTDPTTGNPYSMRTIKEMNPQIFNWLDMLDTNVAIILVLMTLVAGFTIISGLLILILEKTNMIGLLKAMGAQNWSIRKIFLYQAAFLVGKGMVIGNAIALLLCLLQKYFGIIKLDPETYYVDTVPICLSWENLLLINVGVFAASILMLIGPSYIITKISPAETIRYE